MPCIEHNNDVYFDRARFDCEVRGSDWNVPVSGCARARSWHEGSMYRDVHACLDVAMHKDSSIVGFETPFFAIDANSEIGCAALKPRQLSLEYFFARVRTDLLQYQPGDSTSDLTRYLLPQSTHSQSWCCTKAPRANKPLCMIVSHLHPAERPTTLDDCLHD
jgi:hypothetical protein